MSKGIRPLYRPIIVPAYTRDPDEVCFCPKCEDAPQLVRQGNRLVCPNGCGEYVLILPPIEKQIKMMRDEDPVVEPTKIPDCAAGSSTLNKHRKRST